MIRKMEAVEKRANVRSSPGLEPATVSIIMANAKKNNAIGIENYKIVPIKCKLHYKF